MLKKNLLFCSFISLLFIYPVTVNAARDSLVGVKIGVVMEPRIALYYKGERVTDKTIVFPLTVNDANGYFENMSDYLYIVGNIDRANVMLNEKDIELDPEKGKQDADSVAIPLNGYFVVNNVPTDASASLTMPVLRDISQGNDKNGFKFHLKSKELARNYPSGNYTHVLSIIITPAL
ncbi:hypothetical protein QNH14_21860 [Apirhabdus apintestini]|uniref:hypothetical protein n=1 Tax=Erwinia sp. HR93 TaxID=3094840 RepID=UPI002ADEBBB1|nr:hypothetical protein [Erwinia sp. HR93]MEA1063003.1 hypothetical protein [Erwinia sp. HR93]WPM84875.1 hypothetical protein QNH14_21860 [Enterobacteriaceae bacterium CA-0114]